MNNTVLIKGKGMATCLVFTTIQRYYDNVTVTQLPRRWWQNEVRYELRMQNASAQELKSLRAMLPTSFHIEVF